MAKIISFNYYRYQLVPKVSIQGQLDGRASSLEEIKKFKNKYFSEVLKGVTFNLSKGNLPYKILYQYKEKYFLLLSNIKKTSYVKDFKTFDIKSEPFVEILINNDPKVQIIAISKNPDAFVHTKTVAKIIETTLNFKLDRDNVVLHIQPIFEKLDFWNVVKKNPYIEKITFEIIKPNISNISGIFKGELRELVEDTNSHQTLITLNAPNKSFLTDIKEENEKINDIVEYSAEGGGNIKIKFKSERKQYQTEQSIKNETFNTEFEIENAPKDIINKFINSVFKSLKWIYF